MSRRLPRSPRPFLSCLILLALILSPALAAAQETSTGSAPNATSKATAKATFGDLGPEPIAEDVVRVMLESFARDDDSKRASARHPSFVPRSDTRRLAIEPELEAERETPRAIPDELEKSDRLIEAWHDRPSPEEMLRRIEQAADMPAELKAVTYSGFQPIGNGILDPSRADRTGRVSEVQWAYDHSQGLDTMYVGGTNGGLWKYVLSLGQWQPLSDRLEGSPAVGAFWIDPSDSQHMLIGTGDPWRNGGTGLYETTNGGFTWTRESLTTIPSSFYKIASDRSDPSNILAASHQGLYRSTNGGSTWQRILSGPVTDVLQDPVYHSYWYAAGPGIGVYESSNRGASFHAFASGFPTDVSRVSLTVCDSAPNYIYAIAGAASNISVMKGIYRSSNYGYTWQAIKTTDDISWGQAFHTTAIAVDPTDPNILLAGMGGFQLNRSAAGPSAANSWKIGIEIGHADCTSFAFTPNGRFALASNDGGVYSFDVPNETWVDHLNLIPELNLQEIVRADGAFHAARQVSWLAIAGLQDNGVVRLDTGTDEVEFLTHGDGGEVNISNHDYYDFTATGGGPPFFRIRSTNFGASWSSVDCGLPSNPSPFSILEDPVNRWPYRTFTIDDKTLYSASLWSSCSWSPVNSTPLPPGFTAQHLEIATRSDVPVFYVNGTGTSGTGQLWNGDVLVLDGTVHGPIGQMSFSRRTPILPPGSQYSDARVTADRFAALPNTVYYTTDTSRPSRAFVSHNRGLSWQDVTGNLTSLLPDADYKELVALPSDQNTLFLATDVGVYGSTNGGATWSRMSSFLPLVVHVTDIEVQNSTSGRGEVLIATRGRGFYRTTIY